MVLACPGDNLASTGGNIAVRSRQHRRMAGGVVTIIGIA
jgi:hypothetical protein